VRDWSASCREDEVIDTSDLRPYQRDYVENHALDAVCYLMWEARLGKTRAEVRAIERRIEAGARRILVVAPQKPLQLTWTDELAMRGLQHLNMHDGTLTDRVERLKAHMASAANELPTVITVNFDVLEQYPEPIRRVIDNVSGTRWFVFRDRYFTEEHEAKAARIRSSSGTISDEIGKWGPQDIIVDEAQLISSAGANRTWALRRLGRSAICRRCLSGTPDPNGSINFYAQFVFLDQHRFDGEGIDARGKPVKFSGTRKADFQAQYCLMDPFGQQIIAYIRTDEMLAKIFAVSHRVRARDVADQLPADNRIVRSIPWTDTAWKLYNKLHRDHALTEEIAVDGTHKLTRQLREQQLCSGFLTDEDTGELKWIHKQKLDALASELEDIVDSGALAVVSYSYTVAGEAIAETLRKKFGAERVALVNGNTPARMATDTLRLFDIRSAAATPLQILVLQEQVGGMGISLARATYMIFFSWTMDYNIHEQMRKRIWDWNRPAFWIYLEMQNSADIKALGVINKKHADSIMQHERQTA
jgi:hypothetical protein